MTTNLSHLDAAQPDFFGQTIDRIISLSEADKYEEIIAWYPDLAETAEFKSLHCDDQGRIMHKVGVAYYLTYQEYEAIELFQEIIENVWNACEEVESADFANTIYNIGLCYQYTPESHLAKDYFENAILLLQKSPGVTQIDLAEKYHGAGTYYVGQADFLLAQKYLLSARDKYGEDPMMVRDRFDVLNELVVLSNYFKKYPEALALVIEARSLYNSNQEDIPVFDFVRILLNGSSAHIGLNQYHLAEIMVESGLQLFECSDDPGLCAIGLEIKSRISQEQGKYSDAQSILEEVLNLRIKGDVKDAELLSGSYENLAEIAMRQGDCADAIRHINQAIHILTPQQEKDQYLDPILDGAWVNHTLDLIRQLKIKATLVNQCQAAGFVADTNLWIQTFSKMDTAIGLGIVDHRSDKSQLELLNTMAENYEEAVQICLDYAAYSPDFLEKAYHFTARSKALVLQRHLVDAENHNNILSREDLAQEQKLRQNIIDVNTALLGRDRKDSLRNISIKSHLDLELFYRDLHARYPSLISQQSGYLSVPTLRTLSEEIGPDQAICEFFYGTSEIDVFWITEEGSFFYRIPREQALDEQLNTIIASQHNPHEIFDLDASQAIRKILIAPGLAQLSKKIKRIVFIPDGKLHGLSFEVLQGERLSGQHSDYLISQFAISYLFSSRSMAIRTDSKAVDRDLIAYGTNYTDQLNRRLLEDQSLDVNLPTFTLSEQEVQLISELSLGTARLGSKATRDHFLSEAQHKDIVYLSLHGLVDYEDPQRSCIIFDDREDDFVLTAADLYQHQFTTELVLLSACHTASGKIYRGEGVNGMTRAFLYAGVKSVLSSLWSATEVNAIKILGPFIESVYKGKPKDLALQSAKLAYLTNSTPSLAHPYYWSNFVLYGATLKSQPSTPLLPITIGLLILIAAILAGYYGRK